MTEQPGRRIVQIAVTQDDGPISLFALTDSGEIWGWESFYPKRKADETFLVRWRWARIPAISDARFRFDQESQSWEEATP